MGLKVTNILTADTFEVFPPWRWEGQSGIKVRVAGIEVLFEGEVDYEKAKAKLKSAVEGREVELRNKKEVDYDRLVCDVYVDGKKVSDSFSNYTC
jgi:endonuclease YncB( thermonuclease family)